MFRVAPLGKNAGNATLRRTHIFGQQCPRQPLTSDAHRLLLPLNDPKAGPRRDESGLKQATDPRRSDVPSLINVGYSNAGCEPTPRAQSLSEGALTGNIDQRIGVIT